MQETTGAIIAPDVTDHRYFVIIPLIVFLVARDAYDVIWYATVKRIAGESRECFLSTEELAEEAMMSKTKVIDCKNFWAEKGFIIVHSVKQGAHRPRDHIRLVDVWAENAARMQQVASLAYLRRSRTAALCHGLPQQVEAGGEDVSPLIAAPSSEDATRLAAVVQAYQEARGDGPADDQELRSLAALVKRFGHAAVCQAIARGGEEGGAVSVERLEEMLEANASAFQQVWGLLTAERIVEPTPLQQREVAALVEQFPTLEDWREAVRRAKAYSPRAGLSLVRKILQDHAASGSWEKPAKAPTPRRGGPGWPPRRSPSRETKYDEETLRRLREQDRGADWSLPPDLF